MARAALQSVLALLNEPRHGLLAWALFVADQLLQQPRRHLKLCSHEHRERGAMVDFTVDKHVAAHLLNYPLADAETEARALSIQVAVSLIELPEVDEQLVQVLLSYAYTLVFYFNFHAH